MPAKKTPKTKAELSKIRSANFALARQAKLDKLKAKKEEEASSY
jgi:hypothetical protein